MANSYDDEDFDVGDLVRIWGRGHFVVGWLEDLDEVHGFVLVMQSEVTYEVGTLVKAERTLLSAY